MDPATLALFVLCGVPIAVGVSVPLVTLWRDRRRRRRLAEWAAEQGLVAGEHGTMRGTLDERRVELAFDATRQLVASVLIRPALVRGLSTAGPGPYRARQ